MISHDLKSSYHSLVQRGENCECSGLTEDGDCDGDNNIDGHRHLSGSRYKRVTGEAPCEFSQAEFIMFMILIIFVQSHIPGGKQ